MTESRDEVEGSTLSLEECSHSILRVAVETYSSNESKGTKICFDHVEQLRYLIKYSDLVFDAKRYCQAIYPPY